MGKPVRLSHLTGEPVGARTAIALEQVVRGAEAGVHRRTSTGWSRWTTSSRPHRHMEDDRATGKVVMLP